MRTPRSRRREPFFGDVVKYRFEGYGACGYYLYSMSAQSSSSGAATAAAAPAEKTAEKGSLTRDRCVDHVKRLVELSKFNTALGEECFQDTVGGVWYRKQVIRDAFAELKQGKGSQGLTAPTESELRDYLMAFITANKLSGASPETIQDAEGMWLRKAAIRKLRF